MPSGFDGEAHLYDSRRGPPGLGEIEALLQAFEGRPRLLEVGGGTGRYSAPLSEAGHVVTVIDRSHGMLSQARAKGLGRGVLGDAAQMPFPDGAFEGCFFVQVLHLIHDWASAVREMGRVTRGPIASIVTVRDPDLRVIYTETRAELGHPTGRLDRGVIALTEILPPRQMEEIASMRRAVDAEAALEGFEKPERAPPGVHVAALERVRPKFRTTRPEQTETTQIAVWGSEDFEEFSPTS
jgi:SAM-dependent methyltransferase